LTITADYKIVYYDPQSTDGAYTVAETALTIALHNMPMNVPRLQKHRPLAENIARHNELLGWQFENSTISR
jgi:hypothetical protein